MVASRTVALAALSIALLAATAASSAAVESESTTSTELSDERHLSRWAYPIRPAVVRTEPRAAAAASGRLRLVTEDDFPEVYLLLERSKGPAGDWVRVRIPGRPNGRTGWVPRDAFGPFNRVTTALVVDRKAARLRLYRRGQLVVTMPVGVGKASTPTPAGRFWIREKFRVDGVGGPYGPRALGTAAYAPRLTEWPNGGVIGFHGTDQPSLIPGRPSHGCIRLRNADILRLYKLVPIGTPLLIR